MSTPAGSGIEITPALSEAQKKTADTLHKIHLDWFGALVGKLLSWTTIRITVDGESREEPWEGAHFVACEPGARAVKLEWNSHSIGGRSLAPLELQVTVESGEVTEISYSMENSLSHGLAAASARVTGTRPA